ncbi:penicillin acylase family protein [Tahibacter harae]|uniref:Penicillin acylase family protein n=1 Tax=Tahibacter harae TaxID=2963937 RepID=A0ABT1QT15_9GAMM|nr:penicillin acylase family protein [Tahibacter harae]MCQ4165422.1 penicillin acylase family protein [Tahibacter harae]
MRILRRLLKYTLVLLVAALGAAAALLWGSLARLDGERAAAVQQPVRIERDALGTATLSAHSRRDLTFALGYVHGQERFFQMDLLRRSAAGELAELVGAAALPLDRRHRVHRFRSRAHTALAGLAPEQREQMALYAQGVNAGLDDLRVRPWEYLLLGAAPAPWQAEDSALVMFAMFFDLNGDGANKRELNLARLKAAVPEALYRFLVQPGSRWDAPLRGEALAAAPLPTAQEFDLRQGRGSGGGDGRQYALLPPEQDPLPGSNNFAVAGALTADGAALVADDMHLTLRVPNIWYRARLRYPDPRDASREVDLNGVTLPGTPAFLAGSNGHIAWGYTNSYGDWLDWVRVQRDPQDPARYRTPQGWEPLQRHVETLRVKGGADETLTVEETRWGPLLASDTDGTPLALAWTAHQPRAVNLNLLQLETVHSAAEALALAPRMGMPVQNFVVGDSAGHIGWTLTGNALPRREGYDPSLPADWSEPGRGWNGWTEAEDFPQILDPPQARLWTANARVADAPWLALVGDGGYDLGARQQQIRDGLLAHERFTPADLLAIQLDDRALFLAPWHELLSATLAPNSEPELAEFKRLSASWSGRASVEAVDYLLVREFRRRVIAAALAPFEAAVKSRFADFELPSAQTYEAPVWALLQARPPHLLDPRHGDWNALLLSAARDAAKDLATAGPLAQASWGRRNQARIRHPLSRALPDFLAGYLDMPAQALPGDSFMPRVQGPDFGASERFAIAPGREAASFLMMPGGQSGHPLSPFHGAGHEDWVRGRPTPLLPGAAVHELRLVKRE